MSEEISVKVSSLGALAHKQLQEVDEYSDILSENVEEMILKMYRNAEKQAENIENANIEEVE